MSKYGVASLTAIALVIAMAFPDTADAAKKRTHRVVHRTHVVATAAPGPYYGMPGSYVPAPPFPFFLIPGPWWLPAHP